MSSYYETGFNVNGITFTPREIDIISCILSGRFSRKSIATFLGLSPATIATHLRSVFQKINCSSIEQIIKFVEQYNCKSFFQEHFEKLKNNSIKENSSSSNNNEDLRTLWIFPTIFSRKKWLYAIATLILSFIGALILFYYSYVGSSSIIKKELYLPTECHLLPRQALQDQVQKVVSSNASLLTIPKVLILGSGGAGKTTLARMIAQKYPGAGWELNAETPESLSYSVLMFAMQIQKTTNSSENLHTINDTQLQRDYAKIIVQNYLKQQPNWILIFDNVESFETIKEYIPTNCGTWGNGQVLITSRNINLKDIDIFAETKSVKVDQLSKDEALSFFSKAYFQKAYKDLEYLDKERLKKIISQINLYPLDISIAAKYLKKTQLSFENYIQLLQHSSLQSHNNIQKSILGALNEQHKKTQFDIISVSLHKLCYQNEKYIDCLLLLSLLDSQDIPYEIFDFICGTEVSRAFINELKKQSFITSEDIDEDLSTFSVHRITHRVCREVVTNILSSSYQDKILFLTTAFENYLYEILEKPSFKRMQVLLNHCSSNLAKSVDFNFSKLSHVIKIVEGYSLFYAGHTEKAKSVLLSVIEKLPLNSKWAARSWMYLGQIERALGNYCKSRELLENSLEIYKKSFPKDASYPRAMTYLGNTLRKLGYYRSAEELISHSLQIYYKNHSSQTIGINRLTLYLAQLYIDLGQTYKAKITLEENIYHRSSPKILSTGTTWWYGCMCDVMNSNGEYRGCLQLCRTILKLLEDNTNKGEFESTTRAWLLRKLGDCHCHLGNYSKSLSILEQSYEIMKKKLGENNLRTISISVGLGILHTHMENYPQAIRLLNNALIKYTESFSSSHHKTAWVLVWLGATHMKSGDYSKAFEYLENGLNKLRPHYSKDHINLSEPFRFLGELYLYKHDLEKAETIIKDSLHIAEKNNHPHMVLSLESLAQVYLQKSNDENTAPEEKEMYRLKAKKLLQDASKKARKFFPKDSAHSLRVKRKLNDISKNIHLLNGIFPWGAKITPLKQHLFNRKTQ